MKGFWTIGVLILACAAAWAQSTEAPRNYEFSGYGMLRYIDQLDTNGDQWQMPLLRAKLAITLDEQSKLVVQAEETYKDSHGQLHWTDAYLQHRWLPALTGRVGLTTVPFGLENCASTPNRLGLDSPVVISRVLPGKRDLGGFLLYSPARYSKLFKEMEKKDYGAGDYGVFSIAYYGGQGRDDNPRSGTRHWSARVSYPFTFGNKQIGEIGSSYFSGDYQTKDSLNSNVRVRDRMWGTHLFIAPRPWGFQGEYLTGTMPGVNAAHETVAADASGWYAQVARRLDARSLVYVRRDAFDGFRKNPNAQPKADDFTRNVFGYRRSLDYMTDITVEYDQITSNGKAQDAVAVQLLRFF